MAAESANIFQDLLQKFLKTWEQTEPRFINTSEIIMSTE